MQNYLHSLMHMKNVLNFGPFFSINFFDQFFRCICSLLWNVLFFANVLQNDMTSLYAYINSIIWPNSLIDCPLRSSFSLRMFFESHFSMAAWLALYSMLDGEECAERERFRIWLTYFMGDAQCSCLLCLHAQREQILAEYEWSRLGEPIEQQIKRRKIV